MKKSVPIVVFIIVLITLVCSVAWTDGLREVRLGDFLLLRVRCPAGGYSIDQRADALQARANNLIAMGDKLLAAGKSLSVFTIRKVGNDANIYAADTLFMTVTPDDAKANGTPSSEALAKTWVERLRTILPKSTTYKPGVGPSGRSGGPSNTN